jgi:hypothetical protein
MFEGDPAQKVAPSRSCTSYLDVSEYILKEYSPLIKPLSPHHEQVTSFTFLIHKLLSHWLLFSRISSPIA